MTTRGMLPSQLRPRMRTCHAPSSGLVTCPDHVSKMDPSVAEGPKAAVVEENSVDIVKAEANTKVNETADDAPTEKANGAVGAVA